MAVARKRNYSGGSYVRKFMRAGAAGLRLAMRYRNRGMGSQTATRRKGKEYGNITFSKMKGEYINVDELHAEFVVLTDVRLTSLNIT